MEYEGLLSLNQIRKGGTEVLQAALTTRISGHLKQATNDKTTNYFCNLPDELVLKIIVSLPIHGNEIFNEVASLGLTCRRFYRLVWEKSAVSTLLIQSQPYLGTLFSNYQKKWTPLLLARLRRYWEHCGNLMVALADNSIDSKIYSFVRERDWDQVAAVGLACFVRLDGLEDNKPDRGAISTFPLPWLIAMHYAALSYQRAFHARVLFPRPPEQSVSNLFRYGDRTDFYGALQNMLYSEGPFVARKLLFWTQANWDETDRITILLPRLWHAKSTETRALRSLEYSLEYRPDVWIVSEIASRMAECVQACKDDATLTELGFSRDGAALLRRILDRWSVRGVPRR